jgi:hypothetical protein
MCRRKLKKDRLKLERPWINLAEELIGCYKKKIIFTIFNPTSIKRTLPNQIKKTK